MIHPTTCPACGVVQARRIGRCPACGHRLRIAWLIYQALGFVVAVTAALGVGWLVWTHWPLFDLKDEVTKKVFAASSGFRTTPDFARTDVSGTLDNANAFPVDVTVRVIATDYGDKEVATETIGPFRFIGAARPTRFTIRWT